MRMTNYIASIIKIGLVCVFITQANTITAQEETNALDEIQRLYDDDKFEEAYNYLSFQVEPLFSKESIDNKLEILKWGIKLSFLLERFNDLDNYLNRYMSFEPDIPLTEFSNTQLKTYISKLLDSQSKSLVYVYKHPQNIDLAPATITIYRKNDIERLGARNLIDLMRITPGFAELGDNNERVIGTRGSSNTTLQDILFLINGHRITDLLTSTNAPDWISLDYVEQVELVKGPGSALYGGSAFNGVVNIVTKDGRKNYQEISVDVGNGGDINDVNHYNYKVNYQFAKKIKSSENLYLSATLLQSAGSIIDYAQSDEQLVLDDVSGDSVLRSADLNGTEFINRYAPSYDILLNYQRRNLQVTANLQSSTFIYSRPSSLNLWQSLEADTLRNLRRRTDRRQFVQLEWSLPLNLRLKLSGDHFHKDFFTNAYSFGVEDNSRLIGDERRGTFNLEYFHKKDKSNGASNNLLVGVETYFNNWRYNYFQEDSLSLKLSQNIDQFSDIDENRMEVVGAAYMQAENHLVPNMLVATFGVRLNYHNVYSRFDNIVFGKTYSPRAGLVFLPRANKNGLRKYKLKVLYNSAFLPPPFLYRRGGITGFVGADNLIPQSIESGEVTLFGDLNKNLSYNVLVYANKIDNLISRQSDTYINEETEKRVTGSEFEIAFKDTVNTTSISMFMNFAMTKLNNFKDSVRHNYFALFSPDLYDEEDNLERFPRTHLNAGITVGFDFDRNIKVTAGLTGQLIGKSTISSTYFVNDTGVLEESTESVSQDLPSAFVLNALVNLHWDKYRLGISMFNATDKEYYLPSAVSRIQRQRAEGRMVYLNFRIRLAADD